MPTCMRAHRERQAFEVQGYQGASDSADYAAASGENGGNASILGGTYAPAERRRRCCAAVLSVIAAVLLVAVLVIGGFGLYEVRHVVVNTSSIWQFICFADHETSSAAATLS